MTQPWIQQGLDAAIQKAVQDVFKQMNTESTHMGGAGIRQQQNATTDSTAEATAEPKHEPNIAPKNRRAKFLEEKFFHGSYASITHTFFGTMYISTNMFHIEDSILTGEDEAANPTTSTLTETNFAFFPARWLVWWGLKYVFRFTMSKDSSVWKNTLRTFYAVPDNSLVFQFCEKGNVDAVKTLFASGQASPWDTNSKGWTPLHVSPAFMKDATL